MDATGHDDWHLGWFEAGLMGWRLHRENVNFVYFCLFYLFLLFIFARLHTNLVYVYMKNWI